MSNIKYYVLILFGGLISGSLITYMVSPTSYNASKELNALQIELAKREVLITQDSLAMIQLVKSNQVLTKERDIVKANFDTTLAHVIQLSKPVVKKSDIKEAEKWVLEYNSTVK